MQGHVRRYSVPAGCPKDTATASDARLGKEPIAEPGRGKLLDRDLYVSMDPHMRGRMISWDISDHFDRQTELEIGPDPVGGRA